MIHPWFSFTKKHLMKWARKLKMLQRLVCDTFKPRRRAETGGAIKKNDKNCIQLEYVLDIFEDLGFYLSAGKLSDEIVHHHFGHYIIVFWLAGGEDYVAFRQMKEPATWRSVKKLHDRVLLIEAIESKKRVHDAEHYFKEKLVEYLNDELEEEEA